MTFLEYLEQQGFQADACESTTHPDFFALAERLWEEIQGKGRLIEAQQKLRESLQDNCNRYREALEIIAKPWCLDATDPDDIAKEVLRLKAPALGCLKCFPGEDCPEDCLDRNHRVTDN